MSERDIELFLETFVRSDFRSRYRNLFSLGLNRWERITFHSFLDKCIESPKHHYTVSFRPCAASPFHSPSEPEWFEDPDLAHLRSYMAREVDVYATGASKERGHKRRLLKDGLTDYTIIRDGFVSVLPSRLYVVLDHDDNLTICRASA